MQIGRLRDYVDDRPLTRKRLRRLLEREVALPDMRMEAHRIIASSLLRSGYDTDVEKSVRGWRRGCGCGRRSFTLAECVDLSAINRARVHAFLTVRPASLFSWGVSWGVGVGLGVGVDGGGVCVPPGPRRKCGTTLRSGWH